MSTGERQATAIIFGVSFAVTLAGMLSMPPVGRTIVFLFCLACAMVIGVVLTFSHVTLRALQQDDDDEHRKASKWQAISGSGRGSQVVVQSPRQQAYQPPPFYPQPAQLSQAQQGMPVESDVNIGG